jgi:GxxExxY protein
MSIPIAPLLSGFVICLEILIAQRVLISVVYPRCFEAMGNLKYSDLTEKIIGASFEVHKFLGNGFREVIYQRALVYELAKAGLSFGREIEKPIFYQDLVEPIGFQRVDFIVEEKVLVETKASIEIDDSDKAQILGYLRAYKLEVGLLINFGSQSMTFKRFILSDSDKSKPDWIDKLTFNK